MAEQDNYDESMRRRGLPDKIHEFIPQEYAVEFCAYQPSPTAPRCNLSRSNILAHTVAEQDKVEPEDDRDLLRSIIDKVGYATNRDGSVTLQREELIDALLPLLNQSAHLEVMKEALIAIADWPAEHMIGGESPQTIARRVLVEVTKIKESKT